MIKAFCPLIVFSTVFAILIQLHHCSINTNPNISIEWRLPEPRKCKYKWKYDRRSGNNSAFTVTYNGRTSRLSSFYRITNHKNLTQKYFDISLTGSFKLREHQGGYWRENFPWTILAKQFPLPKNTGASKVNRKNYSKVNTYSEKVAFEKVFWNCRMVGKRKTSTRALRLYNWKVLRATLVYCNRQYYR